MIVNFFFNKIEFQKLKQIINPFFKEIENEETIRIRDYNRSCCSGHTSAVGRQKFNRLGTHAWRLEQGQPNIRGKRS